MRIKILFFLSIVLLVSCGKQTIETNNSSDSNIFDNLAVNQKLKFVLYIANINDINEFKYQKDTLIWEVKQVTNESIQISEYLSSGSNSLNGNNLISHADETFQIKINKIGDKYLISSDDERKSSRVLFNSNNFHLIKSYNNSNIIQLNDWLPNASIQSSEGLVQDMIINSKQYSKLNIVVDNSNLATTNIGSYFIYSPNGMIIRTLQYNTFNHIAFGWDIIN